MASKTTTVTIPEGHVVYIDGTARHAGDTINVTAAYAKELADLWAGPTTAEPANEDNTGE